MPENAAAEGGFGRDAPDRSSSRDNDRGGQREAEETKAAETFDTVMDNVNRPDRAPADPSPETATTIDDDRDDRNGTDRSDNRLDHAAGPPGIGAPPSSPSLSDTADEPDDRDDRDKAEGMIGALDETFGGPVDPTAGANHPANEFSGLGSSGGPIDNALSGPDSLNSHVGYGPDETMSGGIDEGVNAGLPPEDRYQFSGLVSDVAALGNGLLDTGVTLSKHGVLGISPNATDMMDKISRYAGPGGRFAGSIAETTEAVMNAEPGDKAQSGVIGAVSSLDDLAASVVGGVIGGGLGSLAGPGLGSGLGAAGGSTLASFYYDGSFLDEAFDAMIDRAFRDEPDPDDQGSGNEPGPMP
ncbi:MAG: hypothetical protein ACR2QJ_05515 [Geminicoccaceae bacterium]